MTGFTDFVTLELPKRPFTNSDGAPGQVLVRSSNPLAVRELVWADMATGGPATVVAGEAISGHVPYVFGASGLAFAASCDNPAHQFVAGLTISAAVANDPAQVQNEGVVSHAGWSFVSGAPVFLGLNGTLVQTLPVGAVFSKVVGVALTATTLNINLQPAIFL